MIYSNRKKFCFLLGQGSSGRKRYMKTFGVMDIFINDRGDGFIGIYTRQNLPNCILIYAQLIIHQLYLTKAVEKKIIF